MSIRFRLTFIYISILASVLVLLGFAIFARASVILTNQIDQTLARAASNVIRTAREDPNGLFSVSTQFSLNPDIVIQVWDSRGRLITSTQSFNPQSSLVFPLYAEGLNISELVYVDSIMGEAHLRVLSVPVETINDELVTLQAAASLETVDTVIRELLQFLLLIGLIALILSIWFGWYSIRKALAPLEIMTETVLQITRADDLSRRIPSHDTSDDEVGTLIHAFNRTLGRIEELLISQKRFVADVGHELRTPLTVMKGNVGLMHKMSKLDLDSLSSIESEVDRMTRLVEDLLLLEQTDSGRLPLDHHVVELDTLLLEVFQQASVLADGKAEVRIGDFDQVQICGDRDRIKQVLLNLISNAINHTPENGKIEVSLGKENQWARIYVKDTGIGISPEDLSHVFERFYRGEKSRSRSQDGKGFGLGLSIANLIVQNHGGRIEVNSILGEGSTFCVWLPLDDGHCGE